MVNLRPNNMLVTPSPIGGITPPGGVQEDDESEKVEKTPFALTSDSIGFYPKFSPETIRIRKVRNLNRTKNHCKGEDVSDNGSENREIHLTGRMIGYEKVTLNAVADADIAFDMVSAPWSGEVRVAEVEYEGPNGWDPQSGYYYYDYTLDLVATGPPESPAGNGIVQDTTDPIDSVQTDYDALVKALEKSETGVGG